MRAKADHIIGSGNVFADLGFPNAEEMLAKAELAQKITAIIDLRRFTQAQAANVLGVDQPKISALKRGRLSGFSLERLVRFLILLGRDVEIVVKPRRGAKRGHARLLVA
jgi:predicted XRE-type DNA-binding protein